MLRCLLLVAAASAGRPLDPRPPVAQQITWLYANSLSSGASFVGDVCGFEEVTHLKQKDSCRIFHAAPGHFWGVCDSRPAPTCTRGPEEPGLPVTYTIVVSSHKLVDDWYKHLVASNGDGTTKVIVHKPSSSVKFGCYAFNFYDANNATGLGCYRFEVQAFDDPAWPAAECTPVSDSTSLSPQHSGDVQGESVIHY
eukprot:gnl/TRDRNA2_/TRDRNA2_203048_c0_seq1.p1 gnl/TRDRNA2_/TRDRNA2_203048_c0~~gnl/TRDRNA2_/TRDRNA2_203048_c0_seq1.p1  ORF type:complete len:196 (-),score=16.96 gnl/TRDRNA2_/TRDRNA2_203048_c0_seq1:146-733(-)